MHGGITLAGLTRRQHNAVHAALDSGHSTRQVRQISRYADQAVEAIAASGLKPEREVPAGATADAV